MRKIAKFGGMRQRMLALALAVMLGGGAAFGGSVLLPGQAEAVAAHCAGKTLHIDWGGGHHSFYYDDTLCGGEGGGGSMHVNW